MFVLPRSSIASFNELLRKLESLLHSSIPDHLQKAPLIYEDASLRKFSVDLEFISSCTLLVPQPPPISY